MPDDGGRLTDRRWVLRVALVLVALPFLLTFAKVATADDAPRNHDVALIELRSGDVLGGDLPLVGSYERYGGNQPGPWLFWLLALPAAAGPLGIAAAVLLVFGLHFLGVVRIPFLYREARIETKSDPSSMLGAYVMGLAFGFGWTPCVGPALAAILLVASGMGDLWRGGTLLLVYGMSMTLPFVVAALFARPFLAWVSRNRRSFAWVEKAMGAMLILFALLIATDSVNRIAAWLLDTFDWTATLT